jgi:hypothetical protein
MQNISDVFLSGDYLDSDRKFIKKFRFKKYFKKV